jgi:hypothetical protein
VYTLNDNIVDFDITYIEGTDNLIVVAGMEYAKQATFLWYKLQSSGYLELKGEQQESLVPNAQETHQDIVFKCEQRNKDIGFLWCVNSGKNLYSYFVKYQLDFTESTSGLASNFIVKRMIETKMRNIVNLRPIKVDVSEDSVAFMVKNDLPVQTGGKSHPGAYFADTYLCLIYKITSNAVPVAEGDVPVRDIFKLLTMEDLEVTDTRSLEKLDPKFFKASDGRVRLGVNVGADSRSIKVFNMNGLTALVDPSKTDSKNFNISIRTIVNGETANFTAVDYFDFSSQVDPNGNNKNNDKPNSKSRPTTIIIIICIIVVVIVLGVVGFIVNSKPAESAEDMGIDDVEKTMKQPDESGLASGNYSKL